MNAAANRGSRRFRKTWSARGRDRPAPGRQRPADGGPQRRVGRRLCLSSRTDRQASRTLWRRRPLRLELGAAVSAEAHDLGLRWMQQLAAIPARGFRARRCILTPTTCGACARNGDRRRRSRQGPAITRNTSAWRHGRADAVAMLRLSCGSAAARPAADRTLVRRGERSCVSPTPIRRDGPPSSTPEPGCDRTRP